jgi:hypothetical protein
MKSKKEKSILFPPPHHTTHPHPQSHHHRPPPHTKTVTPSAAATKKQQNVSIDEKHTTLMNEFYHIEMETIPRLKNEKEYLKASLKSLKENQLDEFMEICDKVKIINEEIKKIKLKKKKYLLDNSKFIFNYFEEKKNISIVPTAADPNAATDIPTPAPPPQPSSSSGKSKALNSFFKIKSAMKSDAVEALKHADETIYCDKYKNSRQYWSNVNHQIINMNDFIMPMDICQKCVKGELISQEDEGILICNSCGIFVQYIVDCEKPSYKEPPSEVSYTAYLRLNHFKEILSQFQAKETTQIPDDVIEAIRNRIKKERITDISEITYTKTRDILRKLGYNKYFEHIQYINCKFGIRPPTMSEELIETLCVLFIEIQGPWARHCPVTRTNFFNYAYTLYQLCRLLEQTQFLPFIPMLKDDKKQREQDEIWKKVCEELDWYFYPTV